MRNNLDLASIGKVITVKINRIKKLDDCNISENKEILKLKREVSELILFLRSFTDENKVHYPRIRSTPVFKYSFEGE